MNIRNLFKFVAVLLLATSLISAARAAMTVVVVTPTNVWVSLGVGPAQIMLQDEQSLSFCFQFFHGSSPPNVNDSWSRECSRPQFRITYSGTEAMYVKITQAASTQPVNFIVSR